MLPSSGSGRRDGRCQTSIYRKLDENYLKTHVECIYDIDLMTNIAHKV